MTQTHPADSGTSTSASTSADAGTSTSAGARPHATSISALRRHVVPGLAAGALFLALEILIGSVATTPWAFPEAIAHTVHIGAPGYRLEPPVLAIGACIHLAVSVALGALFILIVDRLHITGTNVVVAAWLFSGTETAVAIWGVLHTALPSTLQQFLHAIPLWASILGHNVYGITLGLFLLTLDRRATRRPQA